MDGKNDRKYFDNYTEFNSIIHGHGQQSIHANMIYCFGYLLFIWHNYNSGDSSQMIYFTILEIMSIVGVFFIGHRLR